MTQLLFWLPCIAALALTGYSISLWLRIKPISKEEDETDSLSYLTYEDTRVKADENGIDTDGDSVQEKLMKDLDSVKKTRLKKDVELYVSTMKILIPDCAIDTSDDRTVEAVQDDLLKLKAGYLDRIEKDREMQARYFIKVAGITGNVWFLNAATAFTLLNPHPALSVFWVGTILVLAIKWNLKNFKRGMVDGTKHGVAELFGDPIIGLNPGANYLIPGIFKVTFMPRTNSVEHFPAEKKFIDFTNQDDPAPGKVAPYRAQTGGTKEGSYDEIARVIHAYGSVTFRISNPVRYMRKVNSPEEARQQMEGLFVQTFQTEYSLRNIAQITKEHNNIVKKLNDVMERLMTSWGIDFDRNKTVLSQPDLGKTVNTALRDKSVAAIDAEKALIQKKKTIIDAEAQSEKTKIEMAVNAQKIELEGKAKAAILKLEELAKNEAPLEAQLAFMKELQEAHGDDFGKQLILIDRLKEFYRQGDKIVITDGFGKSIESILEGAKSLITKKLN